VGVVHRTEAPQTGQARHHQRARRSVKPHRTSNILQWRTCSNRSRGVKSVRVSSNHVCTASEACGPSRENGRKGSVPRSRFREVTCVASIWSTAARLRCRRGVGEAAHTAVSMSACLPACPCLRVCRVNVPVSLYVRLSACQVTEGRWQLAKRGNRGMMICCAWRAAAR